MITANVSEKVSYVQKKKKKKKIIAGVLAQLFIRIIGILKAFLIIKQLFARVTISVLKARKILQQEILQVLFQ